MHLAAPGQRPSSTASRERDTQLRAVMDSLRRIVRGLRLSSREAERRAGVSSAQLFVLQTLAEGPALSIQDLAERTLTDASSVSVVVRRLAEKKLVSRKSSPEDARRVELGLTTAGRRLLSTCPEPMQTRLVAGLRHMQASELTSLTQGLAALVREIGIGTTAAGMFFEQEAPSSRAPARAKAPRRDRPRDP